MGGNQSSEQKQKKGGKDSQRRRLGSTKPNNGNGFQQSEVFPSYPNQNVDIENFKQGGLKTDYNNTENKKKNKYEPDPLRLKYNQGKPTVPGMETETGGMSHHDIQKELEKGKKIVRALYDYSSGVDPSTVDTPDLDFLKGDVMEVLKEDGDWWYAKNMRSLEEGFIPNTYVALVNSIQSFEWFHGRIGRKDAEKVLLDARNPTGTYLIRESESVVGAYSLSVLDVDQQRNRAVKHYRIRDLDDGGCYITSKRQCQSLEDLVTYYQGQADGLCCRLTKACSKLSPVMWDLSRDARDKWEIDRKAVIKMELLGSGNFGEVWKGLWNKKTNVAIKTLKPGTMEKNKFLEEAGIMKKLRHPKLIRLFAICSREEPIYIITELMVNGCLLQYLRNDMGKTLKWNILLDISAQVASGMQYIESQQHIHRDLAARNVLVGETNMVKIGDFGLARAISEDIYEAAQGSKFPIKWTAPEAVTHGRFTIKSDVWAFGIFLIELVTYGQMPYPGMTNSEVLAQLEKGYRHPMPTPRDTSAEVKQGMVNMYEVMMDCWKKNPDSRPTFESLFNTLDDFVVATQNGYAETPK